jgi:hypothetical protein
MINQLKSLTHIAIHKIGIRAFKLTVNHSNIIIDNHQVINIIHLEDKNPDTLPDFICKLSNDSEVKVLIVADSNGKTQNFFCDSRKLESTSDYIAYYFTNKFMLYLIPTNEFSIWLEKNKDNADKVTPYLNRTQSIDGYLVKIAILLEEIPKIQEIPIT